MRSRAWKLSAGTAALLIALAVAVGAASDAGAAQRRVLGEMFGGAG